MTAKKERVRRKKKIKGSDPIQVDNSLDSWSKRGARTVYAGDAVFGLSVAGLGGVTPTGFLREEDQGAFFIAIQLPDGASVARTSEVVGQVEDILKSMPQVRDTISVIGYSFLDSFSSSNSDAGCALLGERSPRRPSSMQGRSQFRGSRRFRGHHLAAHPEGKGADHKARFRRARSAR
jgi:multidrug efflux pump subunit AcrB